MPKAEISVNPSVQIYRTAPASCAVYTPVVHLIVGIWSVDVSSVNALYRGADMAESHPSVGTSQLR